MVGSSCATSTRSGFQTDPPRWAPRREVHCPQLVDGPRRRHREVARFRHVVPMWQRGLAELDRCAARSSSVEREGRCRSRGLGTYRVLNAPARRSHPPSSSRRQRRHARHDERIGVRRRAVVADERLQFSGGSGGLTTGRRSCCARASADGDRECQNERGREDTVSSESRAKRGWGRKSWRERSSARQPLSTARTLVLHRSTARIPGYTHPRWLCPSVGGTTAAARNARSPRS